MSRVIEREFNSHQTILEQTVRQSSQLIENQSILFIKCFQSGKKVPMGGNGGSAADAQHIAGEFIKRFGFNRGLCLHEFVGM